MQGAAIRRLSDIPRARYVVFTWRDPARDRGIERRRRQRLGEPFYRGWGLTDEQYELIVQQQDMRLAQCPAPRPFAGNDVLDDEAEDTEREPDIVEQIVEILDDLERDLFGESKSEGPSFV